MIWKPLLWWLFQSVVVSLIRSLLVLMGLGAKSQRTSLFGLIFGPDGQMDRQDRRGAGGRSLSLVAQPPLTPPVLVRLGWVWQCNGQCVSTAALRRTCQFHNTGDGLCTICTVFAACFYLALMVHRFRMEMCVKVPKNVRNSLVARRCQAPCCPVRHRGMSWLMLPVKQWPPHNTNDAS